jgi:hypothetical protein
MNLYSLFLVAVLMTGQEKWDPKKPRPIVVEVLRDVEVVKGVSLKKGERFETLGDLGEGACRIRYRQKTFTVAECYWMGGFRDARADTFKVVPRVVSEGRPK